MSRTSRVNSLRDGRRVLKTHQGFRKVMRAEALNLDFQVQIEENKTDHSFEEDWTDQMYNWEQYNWEQYKLLNRVIYDDGLVKLEVEAYIPVKQLCLHLNLTTWWGNHYVGRGIIPHCSIKGVIKAFKAYVEELKCKEVEIPFCICPYDEDGKRDYRVCVYQKLGFEIDPDDPDFLIFWT